MKNKAVTSARSIHKEGGVLGFPLPAHQYREPEDLTEACAGLQVLVDLIGTPAFQRLKEVRFLGAIDYAKIPYPNGNSRYVRHTRFEHSIGVMRLALHYADLRALDTKGRTVLGAAALLHDVGHPPLSHSVESVFAQALNIDHHRASIAIVRGKHPLGMQVRETLNAYGIDAQEVVDVLCGQDEQFQGFFSGPINFDTIEGVLRTYRYSNDSDVGLNPAVVTEAATLRETEKHREIVDAFWMQKHWIYQNLIHSEIGLLSDHVCRVYLKDQIDHVDSTWFFIDENELFHRLQGLKELLLSDSFQRRARQYVDEEIQFTKRDYFVDESGDFFAREDALRYQNTRCRTAIRWDVPTHDHLEDTEEKTQKDLFYELTI